MLLILVNCIRWIYSVFISISAKNEKKKQKLEIKAEESKEIAVCSSVFDEELSEKRLLAHIDETFKLK